jgi:hypothetical protein
MRLSTCLSSSSWQSEATRDLSPCSNSSNLLASSRGDFTASLNLPATIPIWATTRLLEFLTLPPNQCHSAKTLPKFSFPKHC